MTNRTRRVIAGAVAATLALATPPTVLAQAGHAHGGTKPTAADSSAQAMADRAMGAHMEDGPHLRMTPRWPRTAADTARAAAIVAELRAGIAKYKDVRVAEADGYRMFAPELENQPTYHFTNYRSAFVNAFRFDPARPTSLLYKRGADGGFRLVGAMYTAPARASSEALDKRVPLSVARWHLHTNWCVPGRGADKSRWLETRNGKPVFGPLGVATRRECEAAGGTFHERLFGWMVHANVFEGDDPAVIWGGEHRHR